MRFFRNPSFIRQAVFLLPVVLLCGCSTEEERARGYYDRGLKFASQHDNAKAAIELRNAVRLNKNLIEGWRALAEIDETSGDWPHAIADLRAIVELVPNDVPAKLKLGKFLLLAGSPYEAISLANAGLDLDYRNAELHVLKAAAASKLNRPAEAVSEAQTALTVDPSNVDAIIILAIDRLNKGEAKAALSLLQDPTVAETPNAKSNVHLLLLKIKLFTQVGDLKNAEASLRNLVDLNQGPDYHKLLVNFYVEQKRLDDAENEMRKLAAANPSDWQAELDLVRFLFAVRKSAHRAEQELKQHIEAGGNVFPYQMALAEINLAEGRLASGKALLEKLAGPSSSPEHVRAAKNALAQMYLSQKNFDPAEKLTGQVLHEDPHNLTALKVRASLNLERAQPDAAIADLRDALNFEPRSPQLMLLLAKAYERSGLIDLADNELADATKASNLDAKIGLEYAAFLQRRGSLARAEDVLTRLSQQSPNDSSILSALGLVKLARQDWIGAEDVSGSIRRIDGRNAGLADQILGAALAGRKNYDKAIIAFQKAYNAAPSSAGIIDSLVNTLLKANKKDQAIVFLTSVLAKTPDNANALVLIGSVQLSSGATEEAHKSFLAAITAQPKSVIGYRALADFYINQKNYDEAIRTIRSGLEQLPDATAFHILLANAFEQKGDYESAISEYQSLLDKEPDNLIAANNLASLLLDHRTDGPSLKKAQSLAALLRKTEIPQFKDTLGWASYHQGDYRDAVSLMEQASAALPAQATIRYHLGMSYMAAGQLSKASEQLKKALELASSTQLAEQIRTALKKAGS